MPENTDSYNKLIQYSLRILSKKRYTVLEMSKKLVLFMKKLKVNDSCLVDNVIKRLEELEYLNDTKFLEDYVANRVSYKPRGTLLLKRELKFKGIDELLISEYFGSNDIDEETMAFNILTKKKPRWSKYSFQEKKIKSYQHLCSKGFKSDAIYKAIERCYNH
jgi:regulatory protein